jgi:hypothetical protein
MNPSRVRFLSALSKLAVTSCILGAIISGRAAGQALRQVGFIDLPGPKGQRFDYLADTVGPSAKEGTQPAKRSSAGR